jgi:hypothetical protein
MDTGYWVSDCFGRIARFDTSDAAWSFVRDHYAGLAWVHYVW